jgi:DNA-3-methyladenine glycosylase I
MKGSSPMPARCPWPSNNEKMIIYHDTEWGVPVHDDRKLFEFLVLDTFQAGLSWAIILNKRDGFRKAFADFEPERVGSFRDRKIIKLCENPDIIRNKLKILATINNARCFVNIQIEYGSFDKYIWQFVGGKPIINKWRKLSQIPSKTAESDRMSAALKSRGFQFVGSTICYSFMQAAGMVNDHLVSCFRYKDIKAMCRSGSERPR